MANAPAHGLWSLVVINSAIFIFFAASFAKPASPRDWRSFGAFSAFIVALFAEMYGFPLTIYLLSGWLQTRHSGIDIFSHDAGHLLETMLGWNVNPHFGPFHIASNVFIAIGFYLLYSAWQVLYRAQREGRLAIEGPYARVRHPLLVYMYVRLARFEEREAEARFGEKYRRYAASTPAFLPGWRHSPA